MEQPPPYQQPQQTLLDFPQVPHDHVSHIDPHSPHQLPALEPTLSHDSQPGPDNPMNARRQSHGSSNAAQYNSGITLQPLRMPGVPQHVPGDHASPTTMSLDEPVRPRAASASIDDPDDRMAAEALCGLGKTQPSPYSTPLKYYHPIENIRTGPPNSEQEPLLSLLTSSHPWLGGTIHGSLSAYSSTKSYTPRFVQYGADLVETTVGTVGRKTGVEGGLRRLLDARRPSSLESPSQDFFRRDAHRPNEGRDEMAMDTDQKHNHVMASPRNKSLESLPAYDDNRSPSYEESQDTSIQHRPQRPSVSRSWSTQLMITTSGLGAALNEASLRSLKFCLSILTRANEHVRNLMGMLKNLLQQYADSKRPCQMQEPDEKQDAMLVDSAPAPSSIAQQIKRLNDEIWQTFKNVVSAISSYTGGALPENASVIVKWQLMSVPSRWARVVSQQNGNGEDEAVSSAKRMLAFAIEGLDMMEQVGSVVDSTISSAERWLDSMGRRKQEGQQLPLPVQQLPLPVQQTQEKQLMQHQGSY